MENSSVRLRIRSEGTDEHLVHFFIKVATQRLQNEMEQKRHNSRKMLFF